VTLSPTPYMGWNTYYGVGGVFDEDTILEVARALVDRGLARAGYRIVWLDYGWATGARDAGGGLLVDTRQWPHGLRGLTDRLHAMGLLAGIYSDVGHSGGDGQGVGSFGHYRQDADRFAAWGFDAVKLDCVGGGQERLEPRGAYRDFVRALRENSSGRALIVNVCNFWMPGHIDGRYPPWERSSHASWQWAPEIAESWRTDTDIGFTRDVQFVNVLRNLDANGAHPEVAGPGHWNDPDYLAPEIGLSGIEAQAQLAMWAIAAAPLIIGSDVRALSAESVAMLANPEVIAVDQDPLGIQGVPVTGQVWVKPLQGGERAVALLNRGSAPLRIDADACEVSCQPARAYRVRDLWTGAETATDGPFGAVVPAHGAALYRVSSQVQAI
jgi:alpha-galactosidase